MCSTFLLNLKIHTKKSDKKTLEMAYKTEKVSSHQYFFNQRKFCYCSLIPMFVFLNDCFVYFSNQLQML